MEPKRKSRRNALLFITASIALSFGLVGSITGTYAWYQYATRAGLNYHGTAVGESDSLFVGLVSDSKLEGFAQEHSLSEDAYSLPEKVIYWVKTGLGLPSETVLDFEERTGYSGNKVTACSSGPFSSGNSLKLRDAPGYLGGSEFLAPKSSYSYLPLAFKINGNTSGGLPISLTSSAIKCENEVLSAVRVGFSDPVYSGSSCIYNPSSKENGNTDVGGILNLNPTVDDLYDYDALSEIENIYGWYGDLQVYEERYDGSKDFPKEKITTFDANHKQGLKKVSYTPSKASYLGQDDVLNNKVLALSSPGSGIARLDVTIFLEGWERTVVDSAISSVYDLQLEFNMGDGE